MAMEIFKLLGTVAISKDKALKDIKAIQAQAEKTSKAMGKSFTKFSGYVEKHSAQIKKAGKYLTVFGGIATAAFAVSVKSAANFETQLANVSTMLDESAMKILPEYRKGLQSLSVAFGESTETLSKGLYDILSASIPPAEALDVLKVSAKAAAAGITDTGVAADAITTILNSYGMSADQAGMVSDKLFAIVKGGKCLTGDTRILLSDGRYKRIDSLRNEKDLEIVSWDYRNFIPMKAKFIDMGIKQTVKILTGIGREIKTTPEHPYLTPDGWIKVEDLKKGDRIAVPSSLPFFGKIKPRDGWPELLGYILAEGSIQSGTPRLAIGDNRILLKVRDAAPRYGINLKKINQSDKTKCDSYMLTAGTRNKHHKNPVIEKLREYKLWGTNCHTKFIPDEIFSWQRDDIAKLLNAYFNGDGWLTFDSNNSGKRELGVCSVSKRLLEDVSHLLLRFGINGCLRKNSKNAWIWTTKRYIEIKRFTDYIGIERDSVNRFLEYIPKGRGSYIHLTSYGKIPRKKRKYKPYDGLRNTDNQLYYDKIKEIIYEKEERVYDLIVSKLHNFVANDILAHNTTFAELAPSIGKVAATASMAGFSFDDLGASIATMTRAGIRTEETMTAINGVLIAFLKPTDEAIAAAKGFGLELNTNTLQTIGMTGVMEKLTNATAEQLAAIFPNIRGLKGMAAALGDAEGYARDYALMLDSAGLTQVAFEKQSATLNFKLGQLKQMFKLIQVTIGDALIPTIKDLTAKAMEIIGRVKEWIDENKPLFETLVKVGAGLGIILLVLGPIMMILPGLIASLGLLKIAFLPFLIGGVIIAGLIKVNEWLEELYWNAYKVKMNLENISLWDLDIEIHRLATRIRDMKQELDRLKVNELNTIFAGWAGSVMQLEMNIAELEKKLGVLIERRNELSEVSKEGLELDKEILDLQNKLEEGTGKLTDSVIELLQGSEKLAGQLQILTAEYELTGKTIEDTNKYYQEMLELSEELVKTLEIEKEETKEGTKERQAAVLALLSAQKGVKDLKETIEELTKVEKLELEGLSLIVAKMSILSEKYKIVKKDAGYYGEKLKLLKEEHKLLAENLDEVIKKFGEGTAEYYKALEAIIANKNEMKKWWKEIDEGAETVDEFAQSFADKMLMIKVAVEDFKPPDIDPWEDFFDSLRDEAFTTTEILVDAAKKIWEGFKDALSGLVHTLFTMAETNAQILEEMAEAEAEYIDIITELQEDYDEMIAENLEERAEAEKDYHDEVTEAEKDHLEEVTELQEDYQQMILDGLEELAQEKEDYYDDMEALELSYNRKMSDGIKDLARENEDYDIDMRRLKEKRDEAAMAGDDKRAKYYQEKMNDCTLSHERAVEDITEKQEELTEDHKISTDQMTEDHNEAMDAMIKKQDEEAQNALDKIAEVKVDHEELIAKMEEEHKLAMDAMIEKHDEEAANALENIEDVKEDHADLMEDMQDDLVTTQSIAETFWEALKKAAIDALTDMIVKQVISAFISFCASMPFGWLVLIAGIAAAVALAYSLAAKEFGGEVMKQTMALGGRVAKFAGGGLMKGLQLGGLGTDTVPAMLTPGEYVISEPMTSFIKRTGIVTDDLVNAIRMGARTPTPSFAVGGAVPSIVSNPISNQVNIEEISVSIFAQELNDETIANAGDKMFVELKKQFRMRDLDLLER